MKKNYLLLTIALLITVTQPSSPFAETLETGHHFRDIPVQLKHGDDNNNGEQINARKREFPEIKEQISTWQRKQITKHSYLDRLP
jgi:peptidoglycan hydrolase CwlO-like protein